MNEPNYRVYCIQNTVVDFLLAGHNIENMEVYIYHPNNVEHFYIRQALIGIVVIRAEEIIFEMLPNDYEKLQYYQIGIDCIKNVLNYPCAILG